MESGGKYFDGPTNDADVDNFISYHALSASNGNSHPNNSM